MNRWQILLAAVATVGIALAFAAPAAAQRGDRAEAKTPETFPYEIRDGRRVPKGNRVTAADGSWREEVKHGDCVTVRERSSSGEYRETRYC